MPCSCSCRVNVGLLPKGELLFYPLSGLSSRPRALRRESQASQGSGTLLLDSAKECPDEAFRNVHLSVSACVPFAGRTVCGAASGPWGFARLGVRLTWAVNR